MLHLGWASSRFPGWAWCPSWTSSAPLPRLGRSATRSRVGLFPPRPLRCPGWAGSQHPGWAASSPGGLQAGAPPRPGLAPQASALAGPPGWQAGVAPQAKICRLGHFEHYSGWARSVLPWPRPDYSLLGRITPLLDEIYSLRDIFLVQHQLQCIVPVLGRLQARTGTSFTAVCWSWDTHWIRPAYPSSPSQSYSQEEDKTDDMVILKTDARRQSQGLQVQTSMGLAHDRDAVHCTEDGTVLM
jgi:hypothetical protein